MENFKVNEKVVCIDNSSNQDLVVGKTYVVSEVFLICITIKGVYGEFNNDRFMKLNEYRKLKLEEINKINEQN